MRRIFFLSLGVWFIFSGFKIGDKPPSKNINPAYSSYLKGLLSECYGDSQRALEEYLKAGKFDEESVSLQIRIAVQYIKLNKIPEALTILKELTQKEPVNLDAYLLLILIYSSQRKEKEATDVYEEMLSKLYKEKPGNLKIAENLAQFKFQKKDFNSALKIYETILKANPEYSDAYFWIGYIYEEKGQRQKAIEFWKQGLKFNPEHSDILNSLGYIYAEEGINLDEAEALIKRALEMEPDSPAYLDSLGWVYFKKGDYPKAKEYIEKAASFMKDPVILEHLGDVYYCSGSREQAKKIWEEVLKLQPENKVLEQKLRGENEPCQD
ncbi:MAG TPA: tetratricopeptide repeat protein [Candidatus Omnitrophica bacterium]|nr:MAG: hypothetical protein DRP69_00880 [Candidatus Omnitrophota bacterium]RKY45024.1 MAG: hypothetical protein DRP80_00280 [Candidatus Omnitrophota bacterium]HEC69463.1 tetratricopeptide repeat protein [Candidatus Omnitrophota bacterium]